MPIDPCVDLLGDERVRSEMKHALRHHIRLHYEEDPAHFGTLSERLEAIIRQFKDNGDQLEEG